MSTQAPQHDNRQLHLMLKKTYPHLFQNPFKPLAIGIHEPLHERHREEYSLEQIRHYLQGLTKSHFYNAEILKRQEGDPRYNLEGKEEGKITLKGLRHAAKMYLRRWDRIETPNLKDQMLKKRAEALVGRHQDGISRPQMNENSDAGEQSIFASSSAKFFMEIEDGKQTLKMFSENLSERDKASQRRRDSNKKE